MIKPNIFMRIWDMMGISWRYHWPSGCSKSYVFYQHPVFWGQSLIIYRWGISDIGGGCWVPITSRKMGRWTTARRTMTVTMNAFLRQSNVACWKTPPFKSWDPWFSPFESQFIEDFPASHVWLPDGRPLRRTHIDLICTTWLSREVECCWQMSNDYQWVCVKMIHSNSCKV